MRVFITLVVVSLSCLIAQTVSSQVELTDAQEAKYWRRNYELAMSTCSNEKVIANFQDMINSICPNGKSISTAFVDGKPRCVDNVAVGQ